MAPPRGGQPLDPYRVLGVPRDATRAQLGATFRALLFALHPDTRGEAADPVRLAEVLAAYAALRDTHRGPDSGPDSDPHGRTERPRTMPGSGQTPIPVRVHRPGSRARPDIRVGPVRRHPS